MDPLIVRNLKIGEGIPKICVPITGSTKEEILKELKEPEMSYADMIEWRADCFTEVFHKEKLIEILKELRKALSEKPILFTFRSLFEGGTTSATTEKYTELVQTAILSSNVDLVDVEVFMRGCKVDALIRMAHEHGVKVIASNHDFQKTPNQKELIDRICHMQDLGADILKIAVMPQDEKDVLILLSATEEMKRTYAVHPIVTMSMSNTGIISRICGETFGSAITFASVHRASAPGQINAKELKEILIMLHRYRNR